MILIISEYFDSITEKVIDYLLINEVPFIRINLSDDVTDFNLDFGGKDIRCSFSVKNNAFDIKNINFFWYRRGDISLNFNNYSYGLSNNNNNFHILIKEWKAIKDMFFSFFPKDKSLGSLNSELDNNKLTDIHLACSVGLKTPQTYIVSSKNTLKNIMNRHEKIITKNTINANSIFLGDDKYRFAKTVLIGENDVARLDDYFFPSIVQEYIEKLYEVRVFYIKGSFYPMAIFSQSNLKTKLDYRNYDFEKFNRSVPFRLPIPIIRKLEKLMNLIKLDTGSIDILVSTKNEFIFLEVNPAGQFDWVSNCCNYHIENKIYSLIIK